MPGNLFRQGTLLILSGPVDHLHIVMNDPVFSHEHGYDSVLVVNISSVKDGMYYDPACVLEVDCHPFVRVPSWAVYRHSVVMNAGRLDERIDGGEVRAHHPVTGPVFDMVRAGFDVSRHTPPKIKRYMRQVGI